MATWTEASKSGAPRTDQELLIEGAFRLLIGDGYFLKIQEADNGTAWTSQSKQSVATFTSQAKQSDATFTNLTKN